MKVLLIGGGGREHALGWKIAQSPVLSTLYLAPGNPGLNPLGVKIDADPNDISEIVEFSTRNGVDLVVIGPEAPLEQGLGDALRAAGIACFGPDKAAARLETSKSFMKDVAASAGAPTARYAHFTDIAAAKAYLRSERAPYVVKADGLAAGKGVIIAESLEEAEAALDDMFGGKFGDAGAEVVIEEFMHGEEASFFALCDGENICPLIAAQDHKRAFDGDEGPNTGGMGAYSPAPVFNDIVRDRTMRTIIEPVVAEMKRRGAPYVGVLFAGLMIENDVPRLVEFNARFGDPECQIIMRLMKSDILPLLYATATNDLTGKSPEWRDESAALVVIAASGYPGAYAKGEPIAGVVDAERKPGVTVFHAGTMRAGESLVSNGGRVLNITATGATIADAVRRAYDGVAAIDWPGGYYRKDIAWRALEKADD